MGCIERRPRCGEVTAPSTPDPLARLASIIVMLVSIGSSIGDAIGFAIENPWTAAMLVVVGAFSLSLLLIILIGMFIYDNCAEQRGMPECVAGVVARVVPEFSDPLSVVAPYTALPPRVDVVVKSRFWDVVESGSAYVFCTDEEPPRRSEIMRCYYRSERVCRASWASLVGAFIGWIVGGILMIVIVAAVIAALVVLVYFVAAACVGSVGTLCVVAVIAAIIVGALVMAAATAAGAAIAGVIVALATPPDSARDDEGAPITTMNLITVHGNMMRRDGRLFGYDRDNGANVMWFVGESLLSGIVSSNVPNNPFSYCEIDDEFAEDGCAKA